MNKQKLNLTIGRFQPFTKGHENMVNEGEAPCIIYQIKPSGIPESIKGLKILGRVVKKESVNKVLQYLNGEQIDLTEQEKEQIKSVDIASKLGVSKPAVNKAMNELNNLNLIKKSNYSNIKLTSDGRKLAQKIYDKHVLIYNFLIN